MVYFVCYNYLMNINALIPLGRKWPKEKINQKMFSSDEIAKLVESVQKPGMDRELQKSINNIQAIDTSTVDQIRTFASDNGFTYLGVIGSGYENLGLLNNGHIPAWIKSFASFATTQVYGIRGIIENYELLMFVDKVVTGTTSTGDNSMGKPRFMKSGVISVKLNKLFPQIVLDSNQNDKFFLKTRSSLIDKSQKIELEANFSKHFDFYAPQGINANTLTILAPNFMQILIDASATFDVEIFGDRLYLITQDPLYTTTVMNEAVQALTVQLAYMRRLETSWNYSPLHEPIDELKQVDTIFISPYSIKLGAWRIGLVPVIIVLMIVILLIFMIIPTH